FDGASSTPFDGMPLDVAHELFSPRELAVDAHINRLWQQLPAQSQRRLGCIAASTGVDVTPDNHLLLLGSLALIAEAEGTLDQEREFCETYLSVPWVCAAVAEAEAALAQPSRKKAKRRREQTRLAVAKHREKQRAERTEKEKRTDEALQARFERERHQRAIMVDGEGVSLDDGKHIYRYMAACRSDGTVLGELEDESGIKTRAAIEFLEGLPKVDENGLPYSGIFGYGLGYDTTKWLEKLKNKPLYDLFHSEDLKPKAKVGSTKLLLIGKCLELSNGKLPKGSRKTKVWDLLKGFQSTFVKALRDWSVGTKEDWTRIEAMKKQRGKFVDADWEAVKAYCRDECRLGAELIETYLRAHIDAGIDLRGKYHGAGSTSDAFLTGMKALEKKCTMVIDAPELDARIDHKSALSRAFAGGRPEVSRLGLVWGPCWSADIASAYPHVLFELPCVVHGKWRRVKGRGLEKALRACKLGCVHHHVDAPDGYELSEIAGGRPPFEDLPGHAAADPPPSSKRKRKKERPEEDAEDVPERLRTPAERMAVMGIEADVSTWPWGPFHYRTEKGSIVFPAVHPGGWAWLPEYRAGARHHPGVEATEAWVLGGRCKCERPYRAIGGYYLLRLQWGKEGRGKVLKLGYNGCYGKFAQVVGQNPKYACRAVAGHITGSTRGRLYDGMMSTGDPWSVVYVATDGIIATRPWQPPNPPENETTAETARIAPGKGWLGVWELDRVEWEDENKQKRPDDLFIVQPGFYFGLGAAGRAKTRGAPLELIYEYRHTIIDQWRADPTRKPRGLPKQSTFHGAKSSIRKPTKDDPTYRRDRLYGRWTEEFRRINYVVSPKRSLLVEENGGESYRLMTWALRPGKNAESAEYKKDPSFAELDAQNDDQADYVEPLGRGVGGKDE
ncbi:MAG TPA: bZIP transcription factor, partial [Polyangiaceae bacterium]|nr:bZIP transcription factor [Polyangiaceae bacterium]